MGDLVSFFACTCVDPYHSKVQGEVQAGDRSSVQKELVIVCSLLFEHPRLRGVLYTTLES